MRGWRVFAGQRVRRTQQSLGRHMGLIGSSLSATAGKAGWSAARIADCNRRKYRELCRIQHAAHL